jgi:hypothetical protein
MRDVTEFAQQNELMDILPLLKTGARVAQSPHDIDKIPDMDEADREALHREVTHKWHQPRSLYWTIITCSIGAAVQ